MNSIRLNKYLPILGLLLSIGLKAQSKVLEVNAFFDRSQIQIGEQANYIIQVRSVDTILSFTTDNDTITYLEKLGDLEVVNSETLQLKEQDQYIIEKKYLVTHFDEGIYTIPRTQVYINQHRFTTPMATLVVKEPVIDTTEMKIYDIRQIVDDSIWEASEQSNWSIWIVLLITLLVLSGLYYLFFKLETLRKKKQEEPIREQVLKELSADHTQLLEEEQYNTYYTKVTDAFRLYIDRELGIPAMEYTSHQLLRHLQTQLTDYRVKELFDKPTLTRLSEVFKSSDLAKFAKMYSDKQTAVLNQKFLLESIQKLDDLLEEDRQKEKVKEEMRLKRVRKNKISWFVVAIVFTLLFSTLTIISLDDSYSYKVYKILGMQTKYLTKKPWVSSSYGNPSVGLRTPEYLKRQPIGDNPNLELFVSGHLDQKLWIQLTTQQMQLPQNQDKDYSNLMYQVKESVLRIIKSMGGTEIMESKAYIEGSAYFSGSFDFDGTVKAYRIWVEVTKSGVTALTVVFDKGNEALENMAKNIQKSITIEE